MLLSEDSWILSRTEDPNFVVTLSALTIEYSLFICIQLMFMMLFDEGNSNFFQRSILADKKDIM